MQGQLWLLQIELIWKKMRLKQYCDRIIVWYFIGLNTFISIQETPKKLFIGLVEFLFADFFILVEIKTCHNVTPGLFEGDLHFSAHFFEGGIYEGMKLLHLKMPVAIFVESYEVIFYHFA